MVVTASVLVVGFGHVKMVLRSPENQLPQCSDRSMTQNLAGLVSYLSQ